MFAHLTNGKVYAEGKVRVIRFFLWYRVNMMFTVSNCKRSSSVRL